jgi:uncharacterized membrane protein YraQ (UPF0718 family)
MQSNRTRTDIIILVTLFIVILALYVTSFFALEIQSVGFSNLVNTVRYLADKIFMPLVFGSFISAVLNYTFPHKYKSYLLAGSSIFSIFNVLWIGLFTHKCNDKILYNGLSYYKSGMSLGASLAYLISVPFTSFSMIFVMISLFGFKDSISLLSVVLLIAFATGVFADLLQHYKIFPRNEILSRSNPSFDLISNIKSDFEFLFSVLKNSKSFIFHLKEIFSDWLSISMVLSKWTLLGLLLGGLVAGGLKESEILFLFGDSIISEFITLFLSMIIELFSEGLLLFAFLLFHMTGALGTVLVFIIGSIVFDFIETGALKKVMGVKITFFFAIFPAILAIVFGFVLN